MTQTRKDRARKRARDKQRIQLATELGVGVEQLVWDRRLQEFRVVREREVTLESLEGGW